MKRPATTKLMKGCLKRGDDEGRRAMMMMMTMIMMMPQIKNESMFAELRIYVKVLDQ